MHTATICMLCAGWVNAQAMVAPPRESPPRREGGVQGTVTEVTGRSLSVQPPGGPARRYSLCETLLPGRTDKTSLSGFKYNISDVRVGDIIYVHYVEDDDGRGGATGLQISIRRRPGGRVPPAHDEKDYREPGWGRYHEEINAVIDFEERKVPLPDWYRKAHPHGAAELEAGKRLPPPEIGPR